ncbi:TPA: hypothetical protein N0F65_006590 [Lagenidium giganteum]|uniref:Nucleolar protein 11 n=1 Tax=Lagenidium giganteum TaxID=4803 RepID=A0AAV2ZA97_9STRA|nr:TPA: hypothetical protein N0F65_006590 [Lagenidium giganteum]
MEFEPSVAVWKSRGAQEKVLDVSTVNGKDGSKLLLISTHNEVLEYCTQARKCVNHWTFKAGSANALRMGAVRHPLSQVFFGVRGGAKKQQSALVSWRSSDLDVAKWKHATLPDKSGVHSLLVHPQLSEECVVVFQNGKFALYGEGLSRELEASDAHVADGLDETVDGEVVWASLAANHRNPMKGSLFLSMVLKTNKIHELVIYQLAGKKDRKEELSASLVARRALDSEADATVTACAFHAETCAYSVIWSTGAWQMLLFAHDPISQQVEFVTTKAVASLQASAPASGNKKRKLNQPTSSDYVACGVGSFSYMVVANAASPCQLSGWDTKFGVQVASAEIDLTAEGANTAAATGKLLSLTSSLNGEVVVAVFESAVFLLPVKNKHSTLASVLGASASSTSLVPPAQPNASTKWSEQLTASNENQDAATWEQQVCSDHAKEQALITALATATTSAQFTKKFQEATKNTTELSYRVLMAATRRCVESPDLELWGPLKTLLSTKRISARAVPTLLPTLMKHHQFELLEVAIEHLADIDERSVVRLLQYFVRKNENQELSAYAAGKAGKDTVGSKRKAATALPAGVSSCERFLVALLALPTNNVFLHHAIRDLSLEEVLFLLAISKKYFFALTMADDNSAQDSGNKKTASKKTKNQAAAPDASTAQLAALLQQSDNTFFFGRRPSSLQFSNWICALLDGHFAQLVLAASKNTAVAASLQRLDELVRLQLEACAQFQHVHGVLGNFLSGVKLPQAHGIPDYSIEELLT